MAVKYSLRGRPRLKHAWQAWHRYALPIVVRYPRKCWPFTLRSRLPQDRLSGICRLVATMRVTLEAQTALSVVRSEHRVDNLTLFVGRVIGRVFARHLDGEYIAYS